MENTYNIFLESELLESEKNHTKSKFHIIPVPLEKTVSELFPELKYLR